MLNLPRRVGETILISDSIAITVRGVKGNYVRVGIEVPKDVPALREELVEWDAAQPSEVKR